MYINTTIILLPTLLLSLLSSTLSRIVPSLCIMISSCAHLALTWLAEITFASRIKCLAISSPVPLVILSNNIFRLYPNFNLIAFERQQLYEIWQYIMSMIICQYVYYLIYTLSNSSCSRIRFYIDNIIYGSFAQPFLSMKSISTF